MINIYYVYHPYYNIKYMYIILWNSYFYHVLRSPEFSFPSFFCTSDFTGRKWVQRPDPGTDESHGGGRIVPGFFWGLIVAKFMMVDSFTPLFFAFFSMFHRNLGVSFHVDQKRWFLWKWKLHIFSSGNSMKLSLISVTLLIRRKTWHLDSILSWHLDRLL